MTDKDWKRHERETAKRLGGVRVPITGRQRGDVPDVAHDKLSIECKKRDTVPKWIHNALDQAEASIKTAEQFPIVVVHEKYNRRENDIVMMKMKHFEQVRWWDVE